MIDPLHLPSSIGDFVKKKMVLTIGSQGLKGYLIINSFYLMEEVGKTLNTMAGGIVYPSIW